jgi:hypothetical protein
MKVSEHCISGYIIFLFTISNSVHTAFLWIDEESNDEKTDVLQILKNI